MASGGGGGKSQLVVCRMTLQVCWWLVVSVGTAVAGRSTLGLSVSLSKSVPVYDCVNQVMREKGAEIPERAVVVPGTRPVKGEWAEAQGLNMACALIVKYRDEKSDASLELESILR